MKGEGFHNLPVEDCRHEEPSREIGLNVDHYKSILEYRISSNKRLASYKRALSDKVVYIVFTWLP